MIETPSDREPHYQPERANIRPDDAFKRRCPAQAQRFSRFRKGDCPKPQGPEAMIHSMAVRCHFSLTFQLGIEYYLGISSVT